MELVFVSHQNLSLLLSMQSNSNNYLIYTHDTVQILSVWCFPEVFMHFIWFMYRGTKTIYTITTQMSPSQEWSYVCKCKLTKIKSVTSKFLLFILITGTGQ